MIKIHVSKYKAFAICASFLCLTLQHLQAYNPNSRGYSSLDSIAKSKADSQSIAKGFSMEGKEAQGGYRQRQ